MSTERQGPERISDSGRTNAARVVVIAGPSGSGKSRLTARLSSRHGWPVFRLDDFYKDLDDPSVPLHPSLGIPDWDHVDSWDRTAALAALHELVETGTTSCPVYDIAASRAVGQHAVHCRAGDLVLAEGIFAAEIIPELAHAGLLHSAWTIRHHRIVNFLRRLSRDLRQRRKRPSVLVRRGLALLRAESALVARQLALGARAEHPSRIESHLRVGAVGAS